MNKESQRPLVQKYNPTSDEFSEPNTENDIIEFVISNVRNELKTNPNIFNSNVLIFAHEYQQEFESATIAAGYFFVDVSTEMPPKENVSDFIISTLAFSLAIMIKKKSYVQQHLFELLNWFVFEEGHVPVILGVSTIADDGYYVLGIILIPKDLFTKEN